MRDEKGRFVKGEGHWNWKGGRHADKNGYLLVYKPNHHKPWKNGLVQEHRLIYEEYYNCCLLPWIEIHHIDGNNQNNNISNLVPLTKQKHVSITKTKPDIKNRLCILCSGKTWIAKDGYEKWHKYKNGFICSKCYHKIRYMNLKKEKRL